MNWKKTWFFLSMIWILVLGQGAWLSALAQTQEPFLRMEMGMHTSWITSIGVDAQNQFIVTGSQDKTVRLWELSTGRLLKIFRPPIGEGPIGMIFAVAVSPDGKTIACGGRTESGEGTSRSIYLFDRESGKLVRRIGGLSYNLLRLAYSKDGRFLVVGMQNNGRNPNLSNLRLFPCWRGQGLWGCAFMESILMGMGGL